MRDAGHAAAGDPRPLITHAAVDLMKASNATRSSCAHSHQQPPVMGWAARSLSASAGVGEEAVDNPVRRDRLADRRAQPRRGAQAREVVHRSGGASPVVCPGGPRDLVFGGSGRGARG